MLDGTKNLLIGVFILIACGLFVFFVMFLKPSVGDAKKTLYVRFANINKISVGTQVTFAGKPVGEVVAIREIYDARDQATDPKGNIYFYELVLHIDSHIQVYNTDEISLQTSGLLGEKSVAIVPKAPPKGVTPKLITNQPIYADSMDPIEHAFLEISELANNMQATFKDITSWIDKNSDDLTRAIKGFGNTMEQADTLLSEFNHQEVIADIKHATQSFATTIDSMKEAMDELKAQDVFENIGVTISNFKSSSHSIDMVMRDLSDGTGTLGKLIKGDDLYLRATAIMSKADTMMNDINHYGLLFHLNKGWQRLRTKQMNLINSLESPADFRNYFGKEVDSINTSMERLSTVLDRAEKNPDREQIFKNNVFKSDFAELLRQVDELASNLRLYNQQLMETQQAIDRGEL